MLNDKKFFFIVGTGRNGSQVLREVLNINRDVYVNPETHFLPLFFSKDLDGLYQVEDILTCLKKMGSKEANWLQVLANKSRRSQTVIEFENKVLRYFSGRNAKLSEIFSVITSVGSHYSAEFHGDKTPFYGLYADRLKETFPQCKFIWLVRDLSAVAESMQRHRGFQKYLEHDSFDPELCHAMVVDREVSERRYITENYLQFATAIESRIKQALLPFSEDTLIVDYSWFCRRPYETLEQLYQFLGIRRNEFALRVGSAIVECKENRDLAPSWVDLKASKSPAFRCCSYTSEAVETRFPILGNGYQLLRKCLKRIQI